MSIRYCPMCGNEITGNVKFCSNCGHQLKEEQSSVSEQEKYAEIDVLNQNEEISEINNDDILINELLSEQKEKQAKKEQTKKEIQKMIPKKKNKKVLLIMIPLILIILFFSIVMCFGETEIEKDLAMVENIFSLNYKEIMSQYPDAYGDRESLYIEDEFAGVSGKYLVCVSDDGSVWRVIFEPEEYGENVEETIDTITASLGEYVDYDSEWNYYTWKTNNLEIAFWAEDDTFFDWIGEELEVNKITEDEKEESTSYDYSEYVDRDVLIEDELGMVETLFSLNYKEIMAEYPNAEESSPDSNDRDRGIYIDSTFAEVQGEYYVYIYDGVVESVIFEPQDENADGIKIVEALKATLGKKEEYDSEWDSYIWKTENLEIKCYAEERTYFEWIGEELEVSDIDDNDVGVVENIYTATDIPNELMNDEFKKIIDLFSKGFSQSGLDISNAETYDDGETYIFYLDNLEFLEDGCDDSHLQPRIIYEKDAIENNGNPSRLFFGYYNPLKSNGYEETVEIVEDIAEALNISDEGLIDNDYSSSSKLAIGDYATFTFTNLKLELTVSNSDGEVEIEIVPID